MTPPRGNPPKAPTPPSGPAPTVSLISLGCPRTLVDSEVYLGKLQQEGFRVVDPADGADVAVINTCSFIQASTQESIETVLQAVKLKQEGKLKAVVVAGCLVQRFKAGLIKELPEVDGFVGVDGFSDIQTVVDKALRGKRPTSLRRRPQTMSWEDSASRAPLTPPHYAYLKVSEGCRKGCSFCIIPKIKGPLTSRPIEALVREAERLVEERGVKELIVVGQDTSDYGVDLYGRPRIAELLRALGQLKGVEWVRLLYCHPAGVSQELIEAIRDEPRVCAYLDMAIEHADDAMLSRMNRIVTQARLRETIGRLRDGVPGITLRTSVIVGFPGETDLMFGNLLAFLREERFERLGAFTYSREEGTASFNHPDHVPAALKDERLARVMELQQELSREANEAAIGRVLPVMIDETDPEDPAQYLGRTSADCPEVDGSVFVHSPEPLRAGQVVPVTVTDSYEYDLVGRVARGA